MLAEPLARRGWETEVLIPDEPGNAKDRLAEAGLHVEQLPLARIRATARASFHFGLVRRAAPEVRRIQQLLRGRAIDVLVVGGLVNPQAAVAGRRENVAVVWRISDTRSPVLLRAAMMPSLLAYADVAMVTGRGFAHDRPVLNRFRNRLIRYDAPGDDGISRVEFGAAARERAELLFDVERCADAHDRAFRLARRRVGLRRAATLDAPASTVASPQGYASEFRCPSCRTPLDWSVESATCATCGTRYPIVDEIPILVTNGADAHKAEQAEYFDQVEPEFEVTRPHGTPRVYRWLLGQKFRRSVSELEDVIGGARILTVCGGSGMDAEFLARAGGRVVATDISLEAARRARERARRFGFSISPVVADVERLPFADQSFDVVYVHDGLHHLQRPIAGLREMARVAARAVSINEPARAAATRLAVRIGFSYDVEDAGNRVERVNPAELASTLQSEGFRVLRVERYAMYYRHQPGRVFRALSREPLFTASRIALGVFNGLAGSLGNKSTIQAVRKDIRRDN
jgi:ubiquinone/menaquinone biosynthesis C-methylase UbiE